jgi:hypothetical protein
MGVVLLVATAEAGEPVVGPETADRLNELGISRIALLRDSRTTGVVLEGWAFDPTRADAASRVIFPGGQGQVRTFHEVEQVVVSDPRPNRRTP